MTAADFYAALRPFEPGTMHSMLAPGDVVTHAAYPATAPRSMHVIRIGGAGMSAVARLALEAGLTVTGSESQDGQFLAPLREQGAQITVGFDAGNLPDDSDLVVVSTAVRADNPEVLRARQLGIPVIHRAAALAGLLGERRLIAVAGTHGKTTTTSMAVLALRAAGEDPAWAVGAAVPQLEANAGFGSGGTAVVEADESDGSFVAFAPAVTVLTNFEADHLDFHGTEANLRAVTSAFIARLSETGGPLVACADDAGARQLAERAAHAGIRTITYGEHESAHWRITDDLTTSEGAAVRVQSDTGHALDVVLQVPGRHNILNALGALIAGLELGANAEDLLRGLAEFTGAARRFQRAGGTEQRAGGTEQRAGGTGQIDVIDDYAHHPREVTATIQAARDLAAGRRVIAVFQPHLFSRTKVFRQEFADALAAADEVIALPIYPAREAFDDSIRADDIIRSVTGVPARTVDTESLPQAVRAAVPDGGAVVLMMGAGDIVDSTPAVLAALREDR